MRSIKSEYDYGAKKKFVDVLGNIKKDQNGLSGLDGLNNHPGAKNMESASMRSGASGKYSTTTSALRRRLNTLKQGENKGVEAIEEKNEGLTLYDSKGNPINLTYEQYDLLENLLQQ